MQQRKNIRLLTALIIVLISIALLQFGKREQNNLGVDKRLFQLADEQEITDVYLQGKGINNHFKYRNGRWHVNDSLLLDQSMRNVFFAILSRMEIRRPVSRATADSIAGTLLKKGIRTTITFGGDTIKDYFIGGNKDLEISWAMNSSEKVPYQVHIPGYQSYVAGIFGVPTLDWRSRFIFEVNFALITDITLSYPATGEKLVVQAVDNFFELPNFRADSTKIAGFLDDLAYLQADQFLSADNLHQKEQQLIHADNIYATLRINKSTGGSESITFYEKPDNKPYILARMDDGTICKFDYQRISSIFKTRNDFD